MGCGSSSLKGEVTTGVDEPARPMKRVTTNFASIDYDQDPQKRRMTEYAPEDTVRPNPQDPMPALPENSNKVTHDTILAESGTAVTFPHAKGVTSGDDPGDGHKLKAYQTLSENEWDAAEATASAQSKPKANGAHDPTSAASKAAFASSNAPINQQDEDGAANGAPPPAASGEKKKSWLGEKYSQYNAAKTGRNTTISDEDLKKYTGKSRSELDEWAKTADGVGGRQSARLASAEGKAGGWADG